jgi:hypothetical protein
MKGNSLTAGLHLFTLFGFALAQPLYDLLARNAEFFVAHRSRPADLLALVLLLSLLLPGLAVLAGLLFDRRRQRRIVHGLLVGALTAATALPALKRLHHLPGTLLVSAAVLGGVAFTVGYFRLRAVRLFLTVLSPAAGVFPALFLVNPQVAKILRPPKAPSAVPLASADPAPVVLVVFDEFPLSSLLDGQRRLDAGRYPHFAALARDATWFRNATAVHPYTDHAVPAILTGNYPDDPARLPTLAEYPRNLFTLLAGSHELKAFESLTQLCPGRPSGAEAAPDWAGRMRSLLADVAVLGLHLLLPVDWAGGLPPVTQGWKDFAGCGCCAGGQVPEDRQAVFDRFLRSLQPGPGPALYFLHAVLPHSPFCFLPSGKCYGRDSHVEGLLLPERRWSGDEEVADGAYQRHLLQVGYVDTLLGRLLGRLKETGLYDRALVVITADHGSSFRPGDAFRDVTPTNYPDVLRVPLFVKLPRQRAGEISDWNAQSIDVLPTIADGLGGKMPWPVDGCSLLDRSRPERPAKVVYGQGRRLVFSLTLDDDFGSLGRKIALFGSGAPDRVFRFGPNAELIGRAVTDVGVKGEAGARAELENDDLLAAVEPGSGFVPASIRGVLRFPTSNPTRRELAVAVNGTIRAVTRATCEGGAAGKWSVVVPETAFTPGRNRVEVFLLSAGEDGRPRLERADRAPVSGEWTYFRPGATGRGEAFFAPDGRSFRVARRAVQGCLDVVQEEGGCVQFAGWAADVAASRIPAAVAVVADGRVLHVGPVNVPRPDVAAGLAKPALREAGFNFVFPRERVRGGAGGRFRFFALGANGLASELSYPAWYEKQSGHPLGRP